MYKGTPDEDKQPLFVSLPSVSSEVFVNRSKALFWELRAIQLWTKTPLKVVVLRQNYMFLNFHNVTQY